MQRSNFDIRGADAGAGGMSISSSSGGASGIGRVVFVVCRLCHGPFHGVFGRAPARCAWRRAHRGHGARRPLRRPRGTRRCCLRASHAIQLSTPFFSSHKSVAARDAHSAEDWRRHALFMARPSKEPPRTERARVALEAAEDGHVAGLQVRRASWREECEYDVWRSGLHGGQGALAGVDAGRVPEKDPRFSFFARVQHVVQCGCELQDRGRRDGPAVLRPDVVSVLLGQDGVCLDRLHDHMSSGPSPC